MSLRDPDGFPYSLAEANAAAQHIGAGAYSLDNYAAGAVVLVNVGVAHELQRVTADDIVVDRKQLQRLLGSSVPSDAIDEENQQKCREAWQALYATVRQAPTAVPA